MRASPTWFVLAAILVAGGCGSSSSSPNPGTAGVGGHAGSGRPPSGTAGASGGLGGAGLTTGRAGASGIAGDAGSGTGSAGASGLGAAGGPPPDGGASGAGGGAPVCRPACASGEYCSAGACTSRLTEFSTMGQTYSLANSITAGSDGNLWFTAYGIGRITPAGEITIFDSVTPGSLPAGVSIGAVDSGITKGPDGNVWYVVGAFDGNAYLTSMDPTGATTSYVLPGGVSSSFGEIATGPDGNLWVTATSVSGADDSTLFVGTPAGAVTTITLPTAAADPFGIVAGPDGNLWVTETNQDRIARVTPGGTTTEWAIPGASKAHPTAPMGIAAGRDGNIWFGESAAQAIGRVTPAGAITLFPTNGTIQDLCAGPDGNIWFTGSVSVGSKTVYFIGSITPAGAISEYVVPAFALSITAGPDGNIWFTEPYGGNIGRFVPP
jgi:streptogramin lyase